MGISGAQCTDCNAFHLLAFVVAAVAVAHTLHWQWLNLSAFVQHCDGVCVCVRLLNCIV